MNDYRADPIHFRMERATKELHVWCCNDRSHYPNKQRMVEYSFCDIYDEDSELFPRTDPRLITGIYREPYKDGWKYRISGSVHPVLTQKIMEYIRAGAEPDDQKPASPIKHIKHNRKAYGIHNLICEYVRYYLSASQSPGGYDPRDLKCGLPLLHRKPFFPTSKQSI